MTAKPVRLQLSRRKGFKLTSPNGLPIVVVSRPSRWGNPFRVGGYAEDRNYPRGSLLHLIRDHRSAVRWFKRMIKEGETPPFTLATIRAELRGKNLACWCPLDHHPCHANVLLEIANEEGGT